MAGILGTAHVELAAILIVDAERPYPAIAARTGGAADRRSKRAIIWAVAISTNRTIGAYTAAAQQAS